jgi:thioredoxin
MSAVPLTDDNFDDEIAGKTCVLKFWASWCAPCSALAPVLEKACSDENVTLFSVDTDAEPMVSEKFGIRSLPTVIFLKNGQPTDQFVGSTGIEKIRSFIQKNR